jgi:glucose-6-phosphate 1-epimerase
VEWHAVGGQLLQAKMLDQELFYVSPQGTINHPHRGGVPVLFPQFAEYGLGRKHGLVRDQVWQISSDQRGHSYVLEPHESHAWYGRAHCEISAKMDAHQLTLIWSITNLGDVSFEFGGGLHPYFAVADIQQVRISGLEQIAFDDRYGRTLALCGDICGFDDQPFERLYCSTPDVVVFDGLRRLHLSCEGFDEWMIWNPAKDLSAALVDLPDEDWKKFICIEPVIAKKQKQLHPKQTHTAYLSIRILPMVDL